MNKDKLIGFEDWKTIQEFIGYKPASKVIRRETTYFEIKNGNRVLGSDFTVEGAWIKSFKMFKDSMFDYDKDWNMCMDLLALCNHHIKYNSPARYSGIVIHPSRVWIDSQPICTAFWVKNMNPKAKYSEDTLLKCVYEACLVYIKKCIK
jgi:hypothetical protein